MISGMGYGGLAFGKGIIYGITGIVTEPYKGAKKKGAKGALVGVGKGLIGLVAKPIGGTVGLVGCTVEGTISTPGTIKKAMTKKSSKNTNNNGAAASQTNDPDEEEEKKEGEIDDEDEMMQVAPVDLETEAAIEEDDMMTMRTESVAPAEIEEYNREKAQMHEQLLALKESAENGDPTFNEKLDQIIAQTSAVENIQKTNQVQSMIEEGEDHVQARAEYHRKLSEAMQGNQLITTPQAGDDDDDSDEF